MRIETVRVLWGTLQLAAAPTIARLELGRDADEVTSGAIRVLGARQIVQGLLLDGTRSRKAHRFGGVVDILHATSMFAVALVDPERRRAALIDGSIATFLAVREFRH